MAKMKLLQVITTDTKFLWGVERHVALLSSKLREQGQDVLVFCPSERKLLGLLKKEDIPTVSWRTNGKIDPISWFKLRGLVKSERIDLVHVHHLYSAFLVAGSVARNRGIASVGSVHSFKKPSFCGFVDKLVAVSGTTKQHLIQSGVAAGKVEVIPCGVDVPEKCDPEDVIQAKTKLGIDPGETAIGTVGQLAPLRGQRHLLEAASRLLRDGYKFQVVLAGEGESRLELEGRAKELGIEDRVKLLGYREDAKEVMKAFDIFVMPSLKEALGIALLEAMALGKAVIGSRTGGIAETLGDGSGLLVEPGDSDALTAAIEELLRDGARRQALGKAARQRVIDNFSSEIMARRISRLYQTLLR